MSPPEGLTCKSNMVSVPVDPHIKLEKGECSADKNIPYREAVGSLMHLAIVSRPDIMFAVSLVSRFLNCYNESHWNAVKKIFKYLKETKNYGLCYLSSTNHEILGYCDADYANDVDTRRSIRGYVFIKNGAAVTWSSQRQQTVALSTTEAEFMAACAATKEAIWIKQLLSDIGEYKQQTLCLNLDNQSAISVIRNANFHKRCKHIDIKYHFVKEKYYDKVIDLKYVCSSNQYADIFTKALSRDKFRLLREKIGLVTLNT
ncbi:secreted RxLR effector protein 161-like [Maniola jurtina]|uniref:secreted RxLR effector protein 161-like n=1 Tax=Maniola jurtina TaxID=191418 RepID=UPI001E68DACF|nr:secreted RxLR effector protein 161-like [Maniola jurtina]